MDTTQLKTFLSLVETGNFSTSAKNLIIAQSTVSKRIKDLEKEVGFPWRHTPAMPNGR
jgi:LysR family transcriptional repressor of citA